MPYSKENVYVVAPDKFVSFDNGFTCIKPFDYQNFNNCGKFLDRNLVEGDDTFIQIIPYILIRKNKLFLTYQRLKGAGEARLRGQFSLGFGGHINDTDNQNNDLILSGMYRELEEELSCIPTAIQCIGVVKDSCSKTSDHIGIVFLIDCEDAKVKEIEKYEPHWMTIETMKDKFLLFEDWARYLIDNIGNI